MSKRVCVIGGGISGLSVAYRLHGAGVDAVLFEKNSEVGGNIKTEFRDGFLVEHGPNSTLVSPELLDLIRDLGLSDEIALPNKHSKKRYILRDGKLVSLPARIIELIWNRAFSASAKLGLLREPFIRSRATEDESVAAFFERRLGNEIMEYAVDPFVSGIYAGDPRKLSIRHAFPKIFEMERNRGSIIRDAIFSRKNRKPEVPKDMPRSITFKNGMQTLTDALSRCLEPNIRFRTAIESVTKAGPQRYQVRTGDGEDAFDALVICTSADSASRIVALQDQDLANELSHIHYPPIAVVFTAFRSERVAFDVRGLGFLVPGVERRRILGSLWTSSVFENRTPRDGEYHMFTTFIGGSRNAELVAHENETLTEIAIAELDSILGIEGDPEFTLVRKWERAIPQYNIGYGAVIEKIDAFRADDPGVFFCSNFYKGISVSDCVKNGAETAKQIIQRLNSDQ